MCSIYTVGLTVDIVLAIVLASPSQSLDGPIKTS